MPIAKLNRSLLRLSGEGVIDWLSGLITNTVDGPITFAALLTPQGKIIADFFVIKDGNDLLIDTADKFADALIKRLSMYKLRAPITIDIDDRNVYAAWDGSGEEGFADPRHSQLGQRLYLDYFETEHAPNDYDHFRLSLGVPESEYDFDGGEVFPANANMDLLNGVDFKKGCFVGQEVVSRMHRKTDVKKRMRGITGTENFTETQIKSEDRLVGDIMHINGDFGMAMIRQDRLPENPSALNVGGIEITLLDLPDENTA